MNIRREILNHIRKFNWQGLGIAEPDRIVVEPVNEEIIKTIIKRVVLAEKSKI